MFDNVVFAPWPRGLYLAKKLSEQGKGTAYVEILPRLKNPFGVFLNDKDKEEKLFLESLGFLSQQDGGFCLLTSEGVWPLQDMQDMRDRHPVLKRKWNENSFKNFKDYWLAYLSCHLAGKVFEYNNSEFWTTGLDIFSDYFLFEPSFKKTDQFQTDQSQIIFYKTPLQDISTNESQTNFFIQNRLIKSKKYFWLSDLPCPASKKSSQLKPYWEWSSSIFEADFESYNGIIPSHFLSIQNLFLPWLHHNLISVFQKPGQLEIWTRQTYGKKQTSLLKELESHLSVLFPGKTFSPVEQEASKSFLIYGPENLSKPNKKALEKNLYIESFMDFPQGDLSGSIRSERELFEKTLVI